MGAWTLYGFHEDGFTSGIKAAARLGAYIPFAIVDARAIRGKGDLKVGLLEWLLRLVLVFLQMLVPSFSGVHRGYKKMV